MLIKTGDPEVPWGLQPLLHHFAAGSSEGTDSRVSRKPTRRRTPSARSILIVEDNRDAADSLRELLELDGYEASVTYTGPEGVEAAISMAPDVVLCDIGLPGCSGLDVARAVLADPRSAAARFIAITGYGTPEDRARALMCGFETYLVKPLDYDTLLEVLKGAA